LSVPPAKDPWIQRPLPRPHARLRLLLLPHAGGAASTFRGWADALPAEVEVCPVQLPGRENRMAERAFTSVPPLVEALAAALERWRDLPYAVFGHSNGALIGFELARLVRRTGTPGPVHLFASGRRAPDVPARHPPVWTLTDDGFLEQLKELGGMPREILEHPELLALLLPLLRADMTLADTYAYADEPPLSLPITTFGGIDDTKATRDDVEAWARHTTAPFAMHVFAGDHFFIFSQREPLLRVLSEALRQTVAAL
jgi:medium-chain acyl-[acyl-carrier-protein] hydrolase